MAEFKEITFYMFQRIIREMNRYRFCSIFMGIQVMRCNKCGTEISEQLPIQRGSLLSILKEQLMELETLTLMLVGVEAQ